MLDNYLTFSRMRVIGVRGCDYHLREGVNVFKGSNSTGKTTLLRFFDFVFGSKSKPFIEEIEQNCDFVIAEFAINGKDYTVRRGIKNKEEIFLYEGHFDNLAELNTQKGKLYSWTESSEKQNIGDFYLDKLGLQSHKVSTSKHKCAEFSWRNLIDLIYIGQNEWNGFQAAENLQPLMKKSVFEILLGLTDETLDNLEITKRETEEIRDTLKNQKKVVKEFLDKFDRSLGSDTNIKNLVEQISSLENKKKPLTETMELKQESKALSGDKEVMEHQVQETSIKLEDLSGKLEEIKGLFNKTELDLEKNRLQLKARIIFSQLPITKCPNCFKDLDPTSDDKCNVCGQNYETSDEEVDYAQNLFLLMDDRKELTHVIEKTENDIQALMGRKSQLESSLRNINIKIDKINKENVSPVVRELEKINEKLNSLNKSLGEAENINSFLKQEEEINNRISLMNNKLDQIEKSIETAKKERPNVDEAKSRFIAILNNILKEILHVNEEVIALNERYEPEFSGGNIKPGHQDVNKSKGGKIILGYYTTVLEYSLKYGAVFPKILILDTPRQDELDMTVFTKIIEYWNGLARYKKPYQIIITGAEFPENCNCIIDEFHNQKISGNYSKPDRFSIN
jgi:hypothetical protein